jgi:hypothetical protein
LSMRHIYRISSVFRVLYAIVNTIN